MKLFCPPISMLVILLTTVVNLITWMDGRSVAEAAQSKNPANFSPTVQSLEAADEALKDFGLEPVKYMYDAKRAAANGLNILRAIAHKNPGHAEELGLPLEDIKADDIKQAYPVFEVRLKDLQTFSYGDNVKQVLTYTNQLLLPVAVSGKVLSSLTIRCNVDKQSRTWHPTRWGRKVLIDRLKKAEAKITPSKPGILISIPSLNRNFLGYAESATIKFMALVDDPVLGLKQGGVLPAEEVLERLSENARHMDGSPR